jgi:hypothetical protein
VGVFSSFDSFVAEEEENGHTEGHGIVVPDVVEGGVQGCPMRKW